MHAIRFACDPFRLRDSVAISSFRHGAISSNLATDHGHYNQGVFPKCFFD